ncbi:RPN4 [Candida metapsilosis]|uniref:RPN4 n=1 Tax=Candida metapsilosis TaxID=273372 RepID=A0A8H7ZLI8_9ASCO|nr:RPN4 [Candida metapsilosis]
MTSLAVLPSLKRTMTDLMDEELYQIPSSPIFTTTTSSNNKQEGANENYNDGFNLNNTTSYNHISSNRNSVNSSPSLPFAQLNTAKESFYNGTANQNNSSNNLGNVLNIPDSFLETITTKEGMDQFKQYQQQQQQQQAPLSEFEYPHDSQPMHINPFTKYANPNSFIRPSQAFTQQQQQQPQQQPQPHPSSLYRSQSPGLDNGYFPQPPPLPQAFPQRRRKRITTIDDLEPTGNKKKSIDEDYLLYNPDISPGQVVHESEFDGSFYVPPGNNNDIINANSIQEYENDIIPGYENDYLYLDDEHEEIEEDLSDDEGDEDKYFHVDEEFDDYIMSNSGHNIINNHSNEYSTFDAFKNISLEDHHQPKQPQQHLEHLADNGMEAEDHHDLGNPALQELHDEAVIKVEQEEQEPIVSEVSPLSIVSSLVSTPETINATTSVDTIHIKQEPEEVSYEDDEDAMMIDNSDDEDMDNSDKPTKGRKDSMDNEHPYKLGAEITANNPDHRCEMVNPNTGKVCNKQFSRPYDLIRHQNTIHASMKKIYRCVICEGRYKGGPGNGKQKTFSRNDALSRHIKIKHNIVGDEALELINEAKANVEYHPITVPAAA